MIIAIDGYSSCGKSTVAKAIAKRLKLNYIDSGAMYRAVTYYFLQNNIPFSKTADVIADYSSILENCLHKLTYNCSVPSLLKVQIDIDQAEEYF